MYMSTIRKLAFLPTLLVALGFFFGGIYAVGQGENARENVRDGLVREHITVAKDAPNVALRGKLVNDAATAEAEAEAIWMHTMKATNGKSYAELPKDDPARATAKDGAFLRTGLMLSVAAFGVADLVVGLGWGFIVLGVFLVLVGVPLAYHVPRLLDNA